MSIQTRGIVLRKIPYTSSSAILKVYTRDFGMATYMISGLGRKGRKSAIAQPLTRISFSTRENPKASVNSMSNPELVNLTNLNSNPLKASISLFLAEVLSKAIGEESSDVELFDFLDTSLDYFEHSQAFMNFHLILLAKVSRLLGFGMSGDYSSSAQYFDLENGSFVNNRNNSLHVLDAKRSESIAELIKADGFGAELKLGNQARRELLEDIILYYSLHLEGLGKIKSLSILQEIFS
jgi:DNA repair protein RecO (recombination protein O)